MKQRSTRIGRNRLGLAGALVAALALLATSAESAAVTISSFSATGGNAQITVSWTTATEVQNFGFNLYRSTDQSNWTKVTFVQSDTVCGSSVTGNNYSYTDSSAELVSTTTYYYRLQLLGAQCGQSDEYYNRTVSARIDPMPLSSHVYLPIVGRASSPPILRLYLPMVRHSPSPLLPAIYLPLIGR